MSTEIRAELTELRGRVDRLTDAVEDLRGRAGVGARGARYPVPGPPLPREVLWRATEHLAERARRIGATGAVSYAGSYRSPSGREFRWNRPEQTADELLGQDDGMAARVLSALGNPQRLALLKAVLERPGTAADLIERVGLSSTGQAYHYLGALQAAGLIRQGEGKRFEFVGHQAPAFLMLLAGVWDMLYTRYGTGTWEEARTPAEPERGPVGSSAAEGEGEWTTS